MSAGLEAGIKFIFTMSPHMATIAANSEFIQTDITYDNCKEYPYIINAVSFNCTTMEWMVIARVRLDKQSKEAYALAFKKMFDKCASVRKDFKLERLFSELLLTGLMRKLMDSKVLLDLKRQSYY